MDGEDQSEYVPPTIRPATARDAIAVILDARESCVRSISDFIGEEAAQSDAPALALKAFYNSPVAIAFEDHEAVFAVAGEGRGGYPWILNTERIKQHGPWFARNARRLLKEYRKEDTHTALIPKDDNDLAKWLRVCGLQPGETITAPSGALYVKWEEHSNGN